MELRNECEKVLEPFIAGYTKMCEENKLETSKQLYNSLVQEFLNTIPCTYTRKFDFSRKRSFELVEKLRKQNKGVHKNTIYLALNRILQTCIKALPDQITGQVLVRKQVRLDEIAIHDQSAFRLLDDYIQIRKLLSKKIEKIPRSKQQLPELVITALIAMNGVCLTNAHLHIAATRSKAVIKQKNYSTIEIPKSSYTSANPPSRRYPLLPEMRNLLLGLKSDEWLFPSPFNPNSRSDRVRRNKKLNLYLRNLWQETFGNDDVVPKEWNIRTFIACTRLFFLLNSSPIITGSLSGKTIFAGFLDEIEKVEDAPMFVEEVERFPLVDAEEQQYDETSSLLANELISSIQALLNSVDRRTQSGSSREKIANSLILIAATNHDILNAYPSIRSLILWLVWELKKVGDKRRFSTIKSYWSHLPRMFLEEFQHEDPLTIEGELWLKLAEYFIQENTYAQSTRSKIKQQLKMYHNYLTLKYTDKVKPINWRHSALYVESDSVQAVFPTFEEFDSLYKQANLVEDETWRRNLKLCLVFAFYGGLRAEEICLLSNQDLDELNVQVRVWWSKTKMGRRRLPIFMLTTKKYTKDLNLKEVAEQKQNQFLLTDEFGDMISPDALGKRIKGLIEKVFPHERNISLHSLRHGFASWLLIRYFILTEPEMLNARFENGESIIPNPKHEVFSKNSNKNFVRVFNGRNDCILYVNNPRSFLAKPEHFSYISRLIGHATRQTTARTYVHSMEWLVYYYLEKLNKV
jgi:integrase